jgi:3-methylcrotonyl-CoA carboxylase alpha subunit
MKLFNKILIANRGEIAVRIIKSARHLGIKTVAVYSSADVDSLHVSMADEAYNIGGNELSDTYLNIEKMIHVAHSSGSDAIHPGYGFLSENPDFVNACEKNNIVFIGPDTRSIKLMGNKIESRAFVKKIGIPMTAGVTGDTEELIEASRQIPFPVLVKAAAGGGGKGMRIVYKENELRETIESTSREAASYFGDGTVFIEKFIEEPRHIEIQIIGDNFGNVVHLFERECSIQRRYQKIIEESPSPTLNPEVRLKMGEAAVTIAKEIGYSNAGTVEFLVDKNLDFYFLEMNTRVQVEHPVTEMVTGVDIVKEQIMIAAGNPLSIHQEDVSQNGHAIECRIYAEDPANNFMPSPGTMSFYQEPSGPGIRIDSGISKATTIESFYDPMISKLIVWGEHREIARERMINALHDYIIHGIQTNITYLIRLLKNEAFKSNSINTKFCDEHTDTIIANISKEKQEIAFYNPILAFCVYNFNQFRFNEKATSLWETISYWRSVMKLNMVMDDKEYQVEVIKSTRDEYEFVIDGKHYCTQLKAIYEGRVTLLIGNAFHSFNISNDAKGWSFLSIEGHIFKIQRMDLLVHEDVPSGDTVGGNGTNKIVSPIPGKVIKVMAEEAMKVKKGEKLLIVEAMKMENIILSSRDAIIEKVNVKVGDMVDGSKELITLKEEEE